MELRLEGREALELLGVEGKGSVQSWAGQRWQGVVQGKEALHLCDQKESDSGWVTQDHVAGRDGEAVGALGPCRAHMGGHSYQKAANVEVYVTLKKEVEADG